MPKMKTHSASKKRFSKTKSGAVKRSHAYKRHLMASKTAKRKRQLRPCTYMDCTDRGRFKALLPYE